MNIESQIRLLETLSAMGVTYYKSDELELHIGEKKTKKLSIATSPEPTPVPTPPIQHFDPEKTDKVLRAIEMLRLKDDELLDKVFPAGAGG